MKLFNLHPEDKETALLALKRFEEMTDHGEHLLSVSLNGTYEIILYTNFTFIFERFWFGLPNVYMFSTAALEKISVSTRRNKINVLIQFDWEHADEIFHMTTVLVKNPDPVKVHDLIRNIDTLFDAGKIPHCVIEGEAHLIIPGSRARRGRRKNHRDRAVR